MVPMISLPETANTDVGCYGGGYWPLAVGALTGLLFMFPLVIVKVCVGASPATEFKPLCV